MSMHIARQEPNLGPAAYFDLKMTHEVGPLQLAKLMQAEPQVQIVDVRSPESFAAGHIRGSVNLPFDPGEGVQYLYHLNKNIQVVIVSYSLYCTLAYEAAYLLARNGYRVRTLIGGMDGWHYYSLPVETSEGEPAAHPEMFESFAGGAEKDDIYW